MASAVAMQKDIAKVLFRAAGVPVAEGAVVSRFEAAKKHLMPPPYVIKPIAEGSSVGVFIVTPEHAHPPQELNRDDWAFGEQVLVERYIPGKELTCAVMGDRALDVIEIVPTVRFYDYEAKYAAGGSKHLLPAPISPIVYQEVRRLALGGALRARLPGREPCRLSLRRPHGGRGTGLSRSQHATRHDRDLARARARGACGRSRSMSWCDGWSRTPRSTAEREFAF